MPSPGPSSFKIKGSSARDCYDYPRPLPPLPPPSPPQRRAYEQFVPSYAHEAYDSYHDMRPGYESSPRSPPRGRDRSPRRGPRSGDLELTSSLVRPRGARDGRYRDMERDRERDREWDRDEPGRDRRRVRSRSPDRYTSRPAYREEGRRYRPAQASPRPQPPTDKNGISSVL